MINFAVIDKQTKKLEAVILCTTIPKSDEKLFVEVAHGSVNTIHYDYYFINGELEQRPKEAT